MQSKTLIVIGGATASGKTSTSIAIAKHFDTEIISADSRQFYKQMNIGTAKPTDAELSEAPHHFVDFIDIQEHFSAGDFENAALKKLKDLFETHNQVILTGGSGLYVKAVCEGLDQFPDVPDAIRKQLNQEFEAKGISFLQEELQNVDPDYFKTVDTKNPKRLIRALEIYRSTGKTYSSFRSGQQAARFFNIIYIWLNWDREKLYDRINKRVDLMFEAGLLEEARSLFPYKYHNALQTVGYQELFDYFEDKTDLDTATELIKRNSRRYAKRQHTWMRRDSFWKSFSEHSPSTIIRYIESQL